MKILQLDDANNIIGRFNSASEAAKNTGLDGSHILKVLKGARRKHGGFRWISIDFPSEENVKSSFDENKTSEYYKDKAILTAKTEKSITSLEEAIAFFEVDCEKWDVERFLVNSWDVTSTSGKSTNYQVKVWLKAKEIVFDEFFKNLSEAVAKSNLPYITTTTVRGGTISVELSDFHIGADVRDLYNVLDFNIDIISNYLESIAHIVNSYDADNVVYNLHGDFIESMTGLNHEDTWKEIARGMYGANVLILANELIAGKLISKTYNVKEINLISGNHDRITLSNKSDKEGEAAKMLAWMLKKDFPEININHSPIILVREIDGIIHIMTHGHMGISKKDGTKIMADYGDNRKFNLWTEGHAHSRTYSKIIKSKSIQYDTLNYVEMDELKYRKLVLPSLFTGNFYSASLGYGSTAGFVITFNNGRGIPNIHDYTL